MVGEESVHGDEEEVREELLPDTSFGLRVEVFDLEDSLADLVEFLDSPSGMVDVDELLDGILFLWLDEGGCEAISEPVDFVPYEPHLQGNDVEVRMVFEEHRLVALRRNHRDNGIGFSGRQEALDLGDPLLHPKHRMDTGFAVLMKQEVGEIAPVVDDNVIVPEASNVVAGT